jgi:hypothetical protein
MGVIPFISIAVNLEAAPNIAVLERLFGSRPRTIDDLVVGPSPDQALRVSAAKQLLENERARPVSRQTVGDSVQGLTAGTGVDPPPAYSGTTGTSAPFRGTLAQRNRGMCHQVVIGCEE